MCDLLSAGLVSPLRNQYPGQRFMDWNFSLPFSLHPNTPPSSLTGVVSLLSPHNEVVTFLAGSDWLTVSTPWFSPVGNFATAMEGTVGCHRQSGCCSFCFVCLCVQHFIHFIFTEQKYIVIKIHKFTSGSIGGYFLPLLFPKHFVFPPSRSWHQKPF